MSEAPTDELEHHEKIHAAVTELRARQAAGLNTTKQLAIMEQLTGRKFTSSPKRSLRTRR